MKTIVILNLKRRSSGVSSTIFALQPILEQSKDDLYYVGLNNKHHYRGLSLSRFIRLFFKKTNENLVIHARRNHEVFICLLLKAIARRPIKIIFTFAAQRPKGWLSRMICARSDLIISTSKKSAAYAPFTSAIIPHGVHIPVSQSDRIRNGPIKIAIIGRIREEKGTDIFVDALLQLTHHDFHAYIIGLTQKKHASFKDKIIQKIHQCGVNDRVTWTEMTHSHLLEFLNTIDIVVACPRYEGFGLTLFEAAAAGCAVIGSNTGAFADLISEHNQRGILIPCDDVNALKCAVNSLLTHPEMIQTLGAKAQRYVKEHFSIQHEAQALLSVYDESLR